MELKPLNSEVVDTVTSVHSIALNYWGKHKIKMAIRGIN